MCARVRTCTCPSSGFELSRAYCQVRPLLPEQLVGSGLIFSSSGPEYYLLHGLSQRTATLTPLHRLRTRQDASARLLKGTKAERSCSVEDRFLVTSQHLLCQNSCSPQTEVNNPAALRSTLKNTFSFQSFQTIELLKRLLKIYPGWLFGKRT